MQTVLLWQGMYNARKVRMNLRLTALIPWMVLAGTAHGQIRSASVLYTYKDGQPQHAYRLGDECFVPISEVSTWGWIVDQHVDWVNLTTENKTVTEDIRYVAGQPSVAVRKAITQFGGQSVWNPGTDTLNIYSQISLISVNGQKVHAEGTLSFRGVPSNPQNGTTIVDLVGARVTDSTRDDVPSNVTVTQYKPNVVRLSIPTQFVPRIPTTQKAEAPQYDFEIDKAADFASTQTTTNTGNQNWQNPQNLIVTIDRDEESSAVVQIHVPNPLGGQVLTNRSDPLALVFTFPANAQLPTNTAFLNSRTISSVTAVPSGDATLVTLHLSRPMAVEVINERNGVTVNLINKSGTTTSGIGHLAGKVIVVDAGHGGHDRGAHDSDVNEKDITLPIASKLAADLQGAGATVITTRSDDTFIPLLERSNISNRNHADLFISCHINSTGGAATQSGTITFYHNHNQVCMYLAQCIQHEIAKVNGLPDLGVWSDTRIYASGFSVLRNTTAPCVLIEMGFINHPRDRARMLTQDFQDSVAAAVVRGVRVFFGETNTQ